jgi:hypothetical protein
MLFFKKVVKQILKYKFIKKKMFSKSLVFASEILFIRDLGFDDYSKHTVLTILPVPSYSQHSDKTYRFSMLPAFEMQGRVGCIADCIGHQ